LTADGYRVAAARSPAAARREARRLPRPAQLLIASLTSEGEKLARALQAEVPDLRILCTTTREQAPALGWLKRRRLACLPKPYALSEILKRARVLLDA